MKEAIYEIWRETVMKSYLNMKNEYMKQRKSIASNEERKYENREMRNMKR